nr:hypothetical protein [Tanacetum cinerariifolium]GEZ52153.1 hypothetical protein [Tanacetum cinerariifolium]
EGRSKCGDNVGNGIGKSGGVPDGGVYDRGGGSGSEWEVDGNSALNRIIAALYPKGYVGLAGSGGDGICGSGDEYDVSGDGGGVGMASSLVTFVSGGSSIDV